MYTGVKAYLVCCSHVQCPSVYRCLHMQNSVYVTVGHPSVCLSRRLTSATAAGEFAAERPRSGDKPYRSIVAGVLGGVELQALSSKYG